jgi:hypothetical protein
LAGTIQIDFDGVVARECLQDPDTRLLAVDDGNAVPGTFSTVNGGRSIRFQPASPLRPETDYEFRLSPFTCDVDGRLLEEQYRFRFRSYDDRPPTVAHASIPPNATGVGRTDALTITCTEAIDPQSVTAATVYLRDVFGGGYDCELVVNNASITVTPAADLPGSRGFLVVVSGIQDRAGNRSTDGWSLSFATANDSIAPRASSWWPTGSDAFSPLIQPSVTFDESMDVHSVESASVAIVDEHANIVPYRTTASRDRRTLRLVPRQPLSVGRTHYVLVLGGPGGVTDVSGNPLQTTLVFSFATGSDSAPPRVASTNPTNGARGVSASTRVMVAFDEPVDAARVDSTTVRLSAPSGSVAVTTELDGNNRTLRVTPNAPLPVGSTFTLTLQGGQDGIRDLAGNPLAQSEVLTFSTTEDAAPPRLLLWPVHGATSVPTGVRVAAMADGPLDPLSVDDNTVFVTDDLGRNVPGTVTLSRGDRVIRFTPSQPWAHGGRYTATLRGGLDGVRKITGNGLPSDVVSQFRIGFSADPTGPTVASTVNAIDAQRNQDRTLPPFGFEINVSARDLSGFSLDMSSVDVVLRGEGITPDSDTVFSGATIDGSSLRYRLPRSLALTPGRYTLQATVSDLSGNVGTSTELAFRVAQVDSAALPFERTQVVWVRFDLDRDGNGRGDLEDDLLRLGLCTAGDPVGTNARMVAVVRDGILAKCHELFARKPSGGRLGGDSAAIRFTWRAPLGIPAMQIACGGFDPEGPPRRDYGAESSGTLGRAYYDYRNGQVNDQAIASRPGLGVFPGEMFLFEARVHLQVYPSFTTTFARRFLHLAPAMGGTPAGQHELDARVLSPGFDWANATSAERARFTVVFDAADDWASAVGVILAHEVGHAVGLVTEGRGSAALHGDATLHNEFPGITDVMSPAVGYESLVNLDYAFRDLNLAYLRQRILLK